MARLTLVWHAVGTENRVCAGTQGVRRAVNHAGLTYRQRPSLCPRKEAAPWSHREQGWRHVRGQGCDLLPEALGTPRKEGEAPGGCLSTPQASNPRR